LFIWLSFGVAAEDADSTQRQALLFPPAPTKGVAPEKGALARQA
jgi:hypothetical protein